MNTMTDKKQQLTEPLKTQRQQSYQSREPKGLDKANCRACNDTELLTFEKLRDGRFVWLCCFCACRYSLASISDDEIE